MPARSKVRRQWGKFLDYVTTWDQYGVPVGLTLNGESHFKTIYGALASIGLGIYMIRILWFTLSPVVFREID